jgi:hypothetical protein
MCCKVLETWGINSDQDKLHIQSLDGRDCHVLTLVCMAIHQQTKADVNLLRKYLNHFQNQFSIMQRATKYSLQSPLPEGLPGPVQNQDIDERNLLATASVHGHPQGEILQVFHRHVISCREGHAEYFHQGLTCNV